jgi:diguanylate cyclase (GGDEF)-like protein/PAS domain S-box-containing protein
VGGISYSAKEPAVSRQVRLISRKVLLCIAFVILYLLLTRPEVIVIYRLGTVAWYPAIAILSTFLLRAGPAYAPLAAFCVALAGRVTYHQPLSTFGETVGAASVALCYAGAAYVLRAPWRIDLCLRRRRDVVRYIVVTCGAAALNGAIGGACLAADHSISWHEYWAAAASWFLGDGIALIGIAPCLMINVIPAARNWLHGESEDMDTELPQPNSGRGFYSLLEFSAQMLAIALVVWLMFGISWSRYHTFFLGFVPVIWMAMRQGMKRIASGLVVLNFAMVFGMNLAPPPVALFTKVSLMMLVVSGAGLIVGSEVSERYRLTNQLNDKSVFLNALIENSPLAIVVFNHEGRVEFANPTFEKLMLYQQRDLAIGDIATLWLQGIAEAIPEALAGRTGHKTVRQPRKDGKVLDLALHTVPLVVKDNVRGVYAIYEDISEQVRAAEAERKHAESQAQLVKQLQLRTQEMTLLNEMGSLLQRGDTVEEASQTVVNSLQKLFPGVFSGTLYLFQTSRQILQSAGHWGRQSCSEAIFRPDFCQSLSHQQPIWSDLRNPTLACHHLRLTPSIQSLCVPMVAREETLGLLQFDFPAGGTDWAKPDRESFQEAEQRLAVTVAGEVALSLGAIRLREHLREQAIRDPLTELYNRRFLEESLQRELQRASRGQYPVSLLFLDLDHFKRFNDKFGHEAGDAVLRSLAALLRTFFRSMDICCRAGGEEFAVILPEAAPEHALVRANAFRLEVKALRLTHEEKALGFITVSIGVAAFPDHARTPAGLLRAADRCLYECKAQGRDRATLAKTNPVQHGA